MKKSENSEIISKDSSAFLLVSPEPKEILFTTKEKTKAAIPHN